VKSLILAFANESTCHKIRTLLETNGISVKKACYSGHEVLREAAKSDSGIIICGFKLTDMTADVLKEMLPEGYLMLMLASSEQRAYCTSTDVLYLTTPVNKNDLQTSVNMIWQMQKLAAEKRREQAIASKKAQDLPLIERAKGMLMVRNGLTEDEAHRMLQQRSMNSGCKMVDVARIVLSDGSL